MTDEQLDTFLALPRDEQKKILGRTIKPPQVLSILSRQLHDGVTYEQFEKAWMPPSLPHYDGTVHVINGVNVDDPSLVISLALISESWEDVLSEVEKTAGPDEARSKRISALADSKGAAMYHVRKTIDLGV